MSCLVDTIREANPEWQTQIDEMEDAATVAQMIGVALRLACVLAVNMVEEIVAKRSQAKTVWGLCPQCGTGLQSKGFRSRQINSIIGVIKWERR